MTEDIEKIRRNIGMLLWDADTHPTITPTGFKMIVGNTEVVVTIEKAGE